MSDFRGHAVKGKVFDIKTDSLKIFYRFFGPQNSVKNFVAEEGPHTY